MDTTVVAPHLLKKLSPDVFHLILSYTNRPQPENLRADIADHYATSKQILGTYLHFWVDTWELTADDAYEWLCNDIIAFINQDHPTVLGLVDHFYEVCMRNPFIRSRDQVDVFFDRLMDESAKNAFLVFWGLMTAHERAEFIHVYGDERSAVF